MEKFFKNEKKFKKNRKKFKPMCIYNMKDFFQKKISKKMKNFRKKSELMCIYSMSENFKRVADCRDTSKTDKLLKILFSTAPSLS